MSSYTSNAGPGSRYCTLHGTYWGFTCPSCNGSISYAPPSQAVAQDPVPAYHRIASALERIAAALEHLGERKGGDAL